MTRRNGLVGRNDQSPERERGGQAGCCKALKYKRSGVPRSWLVPSLTLRARTGTLCRVFLAILLLPGIVRAQSVRQTPQPAPLPPLIPLPAPAETPPVENLQSFDGRDARLVWNDRRWQIVVGERVLKDFGRRENDARGALRLIQDLELTQRGTVGAPAPVMEYWLSHGHGPTGITPGLRALAIDLSSLRVEQIQAQWCLRDDLRILYNFGLRPQEAQRALAIVRKYGFDRIAVLGQAAPEMTVWLCSAEPWNTSGPLASAHGRARPQKQANPSPGPQTMGSIVTAALPPLQEGGPTLHRTHLVAAKGARGADKMAPSLPGWDEQGEWIPFDWRQVQLRQEEGGWKLAAGSIVLACFGTDAETAQQALAAVRHYRLTEQCRVGAPEPVFCYYLSNGQAPRGLMFGLPSIAFQPSKLSVERLGSIWALCEAQKVLILLGDQVEDARRLLEVIQHQQFDRIIQLGPPEHPAMTLLVRVH